MPKRRSPKYVNALVTPIHRTATYFFESSADVVGYHTGRTKLGRYGRYDNPSWIETEAKLASLDVADEALLFPSGMSAIATTLQTFLGAGDRLLFTGKGYRNIRAYCFEVLAKGAVEVEALPLGAGEDVYQAIEDAADRGSLSVVFLESPSNPHLSVVDVPRVRRLVGPGCTLVVDSTFATPINYRPLEAGADLVVHSCGKYIGGHADILAGSVAGSAPLIEAIRTTRNISGAIADPATAFLLSRSIDSLGLRMERLNEAGTKLATFLEASPSVEFVFYTGLSSHPDHALASQMFSGHGGVVTFQIVGDRDRVSRFVDAVQIPYMGTNFGSSHSMIEQLAVFTYYGESAEELNLLGISDGLVRFSIGFADDIDSIMADIQTALVTSA